ncbi:MAG: LytTR family DNA-binding domain-containing protein, partial [Catalinimonas sp.]
AYTRLHLQGGRDLLISKKLGYFEELLGETPHFFRVHRSHLLNLDRLRRYQRGESLLTLDDGTQVRLSRDRKAGFERRVEQMQP